MLEDKDNNMESLEFSVEDDDDLRYTGRRPRRSPVFGIEGLPIKWILLGAAGFLLVLVLAVGVSGRGGRITADEFNAVRSSLERVEQRLAAIETMAERVALVERQESERQDSIRNMNQTLGSLSQRVAALTERVESTQQKAPAAKAPPSPAPAAPAPAKGTAVHEVRPGETLYAIARKYNMTIADIARLNKLGGNMTIHPGQKLVVNR